MAKKEDKRLGDDPFERFLPQIQDSRKKKDAAASADESVSANESKSKSAEKSTSKSESKNTSTRTSKITSTDISDDDSKSASNGKSESKIDDAGTITSNGTIESTNESAGATAIKIARKNKNSGYVKMTHYFRQDQLEAIETLHKESGRDKSELVRLAVDILIRQAEVE